MQCYVFLFRKDTITAISNQSNVGVGKSLCLHSYFEIITSLGGEGCIGTYINVGKCCEMSYLSVLLPLVTFCVCFP